MRIASLKVYKFDELSDKAKKKARDYIISTEVYPFDDWYQTIIEDWTNKLDGFGFYNVEISFSGFASQGDGASFTASIQLDEFIDNTQKDVTYDDIRQAIKEGRIIITENIIKRDKFTKYSHENTTTLYLDYIPNCDDEKDVVHQPYFEKTFRDLYEVIEHEMRDINKTIYRSLDKEYFKLLEDDNVDDFIINNEYEFLENGELFTKQKLEQDGKHDSGIINGEHSNTTGDTDSIREPNS